MTHFAEFTIPSTTFTIRAAMLKNQGTQDLSVWAGERYWTVKLYEPLRAIRLHGRGTPFLNPDAPLDKAMWWSNRTGSWYSLGDEALSLSEFQQGASLPHSFSALTEFMLSSGTILNVGIASKRFLGRVGGMVQAEWIAGPQATVSVDGGLLMDRSGNA